MSQTERSARSGFEAPRFCPTSVAAALLNPHDGKITKIIIRTAIVYPATATLPNELTMRTKTIQLVWLIANWNIPLIDTRISRTMTFQSTRTTRAVIRTRLLPRKRIHS